jgi:hypothetical protein
MPNTSGPNAPIEFDCGAGVPPLRPQAGRLCHGLWLLLLPLAAGCMEFTHFGQVSDREAAWSVGGVLIEQMQSDGSWKQLGRTDGKGKYAIFKHLIKGGGRIRLSKAGYQPVVMSEGDFLQQTNILLSPTGETGSGEFGNL